MNLLVLHSVMHVTVLVRGSMEHVSQLVIERCFTRLYLGFLWGFSVFLGKGGIRCSVDHLHPVHNAWMEEQILEVV
jgi:hypothetical protein